MGIVWILSYTDGAGKILERAVELRETIYWIFTANILDEAASDGDLVTLNQELREALAPLRLSTELWGLCTRFRVEWGLARSDLLTNSEVGVKAADLQ